MGKKIVLTGTTLTDLSAPKLIAVDPMESSGSLLLIEPNHPASPWAAGVPVNNAVIPNLLKDTLATGDAAFLTDGGLTSTKGLLERSTKGGLHGIVSQSVALASGNGARILPGAALRAYVYANLTNDYYISIWDRLTRAQLSTSEYAMDYGTASSTSSGISHTNALAWVVVPSTTHIGSRAAGNAVGPRFGSVGTTAATMASSAHMDGAALPQMGAPVGGYNNAVLSTRNNKWSSFLFYRIYIEDLTVSGRTYAQVDALDYSLYEKEVLTSGGRYYGDTYTDPATIP